MKYRRVEAENKSDRETCKKCCFKKGDDLCAAHFCELDDGLRRTVPFYFIEEKGEEIEPVKAK